MKNTMRVADVLVGELADQGLSQVFMVTGGGAMHLNDAFGRNPAMNLLFNHHEQASAIAAESYCRLSGRPAIVSVTTGPGGINALNGVYGAYVDSIAMVVVSGQIKRDTMLCNFPLALRQLGDQEVDIISMVRPIVKYAVELQDPRRVREVVAKAVHVARSGRPGPVWIDVPMDVQGALVDAARLPVWHADAPGALLDLRGDPDLSPNTLGDFGTASDEQLAASAKTIADRLRTAKRPVLLGGTGVGIAGCRQEFLDLARLLDIPAVAGWNAYDLIPNAHPCYAGRPGTVGDRPGNFTVQNADFLLTLGCRLNIRQVSYNWDAFACRAWKAQVDVDPAELAKPTLRNDLAVQADLRRFLPALRAALADWQPRPEHSAYLRWCRQQVERYPVLQARHRTSAVVNPYYFMDRLFAQLSAGDVVVAANATAAVVSAQAGEMREGVRLYSNSGDASMGYDLPAAIGACAARPGGRVICLAGDGSVMMNLQELQTIIGARMPVIIFLLNNDGYLSIRQTQEAFFPDNRLGTGPQNGVTFPDFIRLAQALGYPATRLAAHAGLEEGIRAVLSAGGPAFCEVALDPEQGFEPKLASRRLDDGTMVSPELDDMAPFLPREELAANRTPAEQGEQ